MHTNWNKNDEVTYIYSVWCFTNIISACTIIQKTVDCVVLRSTSTFISNKLKTTYIADPQTFRCGNPSSNYSFCKVVHCMSHTPP